VLFDADGDLILQDPPDDAETDRSDPVGIRQTPVGPMCVFEPSPGKSRSDRLASIERGTLVNMPLGPKSRIASASGSPVGDPGAFWAVVAPAGYNPILQDECGWGTFVRDAQGETIARADNCDETIVYAEVPLERVSPDE
jgi:hypothetical protein